MVPCRWTISINLKTKLGDPFESPIWIRVVYWKLRSNTEAHQKLNTKIIKLVLWQNCWDITQVILNAKCQVLLVRW